MIYTKWSWLSSTSCINLGLMGGPHLSSILSVLRQFPRAPHKLNTIQVHSEMNHASSGIVVVHQSHFVFKQFTEYIDQTQLLCFLAMI